MSDFDFINFLMINDVGKSTKNNEHLADLRERAAHIAKVTGKEPTSWYEFKQVSPPEPPKTMRNLGLGAIIGGGIGALVGVLLPITAPIVLPLTLSGAFMGGAIGGFSDTENTQRDKLVGEYESYLDRFEATVGHAASASPGITRHKSTHAADLVASRQHAAHGAVATL